MLHGTISELEQPLTELEVQTRTIALHVSMQINNTDNLDKISNYVVSTSSLINGCSILIPAKDNKEEYIVYNYRNQNDSIITRRQRNTNMMKSEWLQEIVKKKAPLWATPYYAVHRGEEKAPRVTTYGFPVFDADSNIVAIVASDLSVKWIEDKVASITPYPNALTSISCSEDVIIGINDSAMLSQIKKAFAENKELQELGDDMRLGKDSIRRRIGKGRNMAFVVYGPIHNGWMLSISCLYRDVMRQTSTMNFYLLILGIIGTLLVFISCHRTIKKMTRPITELSDAALKMAKGSFNATMPEINSQDEMKNLRDSFVYMQNSIVDYIEELRTTTRANERMESELNVARNIQMGMLRSDFPDHLYAFLSPAREVGGDLYDFYVNNNTLYFSIGDVSGKGVPASLMMAITRAALRFVASLNIPMDQTLERINRSVTDSNSNNMFVTLFVGRINLKTGHMEFCNAGHNPIIIIPPNGKPYFLKAKANIAIGLFEDFVFHDESIDLAPGTRIVAYTDGVNEAEKDDKTLFGNDRLLAWADEPRTKDPKTTDKEVVETLYSNVKTFTEGNPQNDDITILSLTI